jgi:hypothetical protein
MAWLQPAQDTVQCATVMNLQILWKKKKHRGFLYVLRYYQFLCSVQLNVRNKTATCAQQDIDSAWKGIYTFLFPWGLGV